MAQSKEDLQCPADNQVGEQQQRFRIYVCLLCFSVLEMGKKRQNLKNTALLMQLSPLCSLS